MAEIEKAKRMERGLFKRNGSWSIDISYRDSKTGLRKRVRKAIGTNKELARNELADIRARISKGTYLPENKVTEKITFRDFSQQYLSRHARINNRSYDDVVDKLNLLNRYFGNLYLSEITREVVENYRIERIKEIKGSTINRHTALIRSCFQRAIEWGIFYGQNPASGFKKFQESPKLRFLSIEELERLYSKCHGELLAFVKFAVNTGMRRGEILALTWNDVDINTGWIYIRTSKSGKPREVPMNENVRDVLLSLRKLPDKPNIFSSPHRGAFEQAVKRACLKGVSLHTLRHTFASHLAMSSVDIMTVSKLLGHSEISMTMRYAHLSQSHAKHAVDVLNHKLDVKDESCGTFMAQNDFSENDEKDGKIVTALFSRGNDFSRGGGIGRRAGLRILYRKVWEFNSPPRQFSRNLLVLFQSKHRSADN